MRRIGFGIESRTLEVQGQQVGFESFPVEYAEVYGVPFSFIPCAGTPKDPKPVPIPTRVRTLDDRIACEITFPRLMGYRYDLAGEVLTAKFTEDSKYILSTADIPTWVENAPRARESLCSSKLQGNGLMLGQGSRGSGWQVLTPSIRILI